ncbi:MAG TPA: ATP-binding cassette domain-containing protein, partial [Paracoccaceae bacterium]|nr:ATP-binding cassette domain-containing protein [Paracoccaceae bacterium]
MGAAAGPAPGHAETVLRLSGITKRFGPLTANDAISFSLARGEVVALLGENGAGKTTLMNILFGHYVADEGSVEAFGRPLPPGEPRAALEAGIGMVHQHFTLAENLTVLENVTLGTEPLWRPRAARTSARARLAALSESFGLAADPDARVAALSVGERQRVEILKALYRDARILILDEPTAVLTPGETEALFATLRKLVARGLSVIFISHKLHEVLAISGRVIVLRQGRVAGELRTAEATRAGLAALMVGADVPPPAIAPVAPGAPLLELRAASVPGRLHAVSLALRAREISGLAGVSGNGQAALAGLIAGLLTPASGAIRLNGTPIGPWSPAAAIAAG